MKHLKFFSENFPKALLLPTSLLLLFLFLLPTITPLYRHPQLFPRTTSPSPPPPLQESTAGAPEGCDLFRGDWVADPEAPYYTNETCRTIHEQQNCIKYGRPDVGFMKWRWRPEGCELPRFDPLVFLDLVRGKSVAFVGDSLSRNHMQSLTCLLTRVEEQMEPYANRYFYAQYNFTLASKWSPFLVRADSMGWPDEVTNGSFHLHLDQPDARWATGVESFDYVIISASRWFFGPNYFYKRNKLIGCNWCSNSSVALLYAYRHAFRTTSAYLNGLASYNGTTTFLLTYSPSHYENGDWDRGGDCQRTSPRRSNETSLEGFDVEMYNAPIKEFDAAKRGLMYHLLDVTRALLLRPDGHPSRYGHPITNASATKAKDCVHWCLPGPIDSWSDFLLETLRREKLKGGKKKEGED